MAEHDTPRSARRIGLVGCVGLKDEVPRPARDLYRSPLFLGRRSYVERSCDLSFVLSALHGLLDPAETVVPYDVTLKEVPPRQRRAWSDRVLGSLRKAADPGVGDVVEIHAGVEYRDFGEVNGLRELGCEVEVPTQGMRIGEQLRFYAESSRR